MEYDILLRILKPYDYDKFDKEPFESYRERVKDLLTNWPACPLENWLYRHYADAVNRYSWLGFDKMKFEYTLWDIDDIYNKISSNIIDSIDSLGTQIYTRPENMRSWLQKYMHSQRTWPAPIIVLNNENGFYNAKGYDYGQPYHLLEGHIRLGYFRNIYRKEKHTLNHNNPIWVVTLDA